MFIFDVETLGVESTAVVLSAALIHFDPEKRPTYQDMLDNACFVKFSVKEQADAKRTMSKSTMQWWGEQHKYVKQVSFMASNDDMSVVDGVGYLTNYMNKHDPNREQTMWARGSLDQLVIDSLCVQFDMQELTGYNRWRDVRTAVDILYGTDNGYCEVDHPLFERHNVIKHHPVHDCALDAMQLMYGKSNA
jgi:hypothetical protein